ncbi:MAG TPA: 5-dehydro-4-deoxyglucarate dehydratase [Alphaproteobacteria bacterium]|nr:5-dehydro-4-deoxyglucarate dehydratase [Alphaproteobacteria bacterium]
MDVARTKAAIGSGLLAFPVTHFDAAGAFDEPAYRANIRANLEHGPAALFAPGGTGEFFSLTLAESERVVRAAVAEAGGRVPIIAGAGYGTAMAIDFARAAERAGADGILLLPQYLLNVEQEGLRRHVEAVCRSVGIAVVVYNRDNSIFAPETLEKLVAACPNLIGFKDGHGDVEQLMRVRQRLGDRLVYVGGMPTAEVFAVPYLAAGFTTYSSAVFNFVPKIAQRFYKAVRIGDTKTTDPLLRNFFEPYLALRNRKRGYAVSIVKAGMRIVGRPAGPVRAPLTDLTDAETEELRKLMVAGLGENFA